MFRTPDKTCVSRDVCGDVSDKVRAEYGTELLTRLATDLTAGFGRGVSRQGLQKMRLYFPAREICPTPSSKFEARVRLPAGLLESVAEICPTVSGELPIFPTPSAEFSSHVSSAFPLTSSRYVQLMAVEKPHPRGFYEAEAIRPGWSVRQLESFLLELGAGFTFVARQKRIRVGSEWHRIDLLLFHRRLNCQVVIDLKLGEFTHADIGQMSLCLSYAKQHLTEPGESDPVGIIQCSGKDDAVVEYAMGGINARVFAAKPPVSISWICSE